MIVWINGPFGVGKSTVATLLSERWPEATVFDPEYIGFLLRNWHPPDAEVSDFQHLSTWRTLVRETAAGLMRDFGRPLIIPMTLLNPAYFEEIVGGLRRQDIDVRHFCLVASRHEVLTRVAGRGDTGDWYPTKYDEYAASLTDATFATLLDAESAPPAALVAEILEHCRVPR
jgi:hypothetical protein